MNLDIKIYQRIFQPHANKFIMAFIKGLRRHGLKAEWLQDAKYKPSDLAVIWGIRFPHIIQGQKENGRDFLVMERGYFRDRLKYCSLGFNGLNGYAEFLAENSPPDRWEKHGVEVKPWKVNGEYILLMGQVSGDQSVKHLNISDWYRDVIYKVKALTDVPIYFRPHPIARRPDNIAGTAGFKTGTLEEAFEGACRVIAFNSNSGVDAILNGVPLIAMDRGSMAWEMALHKIRLGHYMPDRTQWLNDLAYKQWTLKEIANGEAWAHLKRKFA